MAKKILNHREKAQINCFLNSNSYGYKLERIIESMNSVIDGLEQQTAKNDFEIAKRHIKKALKKFDKYY